MTRTLLFKTERSLKPGTKKRMPSFYYRNPFHLLLAFPLILHGLATPVFSLEPEISADEIPPFEQPEDESEEGFETVNWGEDSPWNFGGFVRQLLHATESAIPRDGTPLQHPMTSATRLRLEAEYDDGALSGEAKTNLDLIFANNMSSYEFDASWMGRTRNRLFSMEARKRYDDYLVSGDVHRMWIGYGTPDFQVKAGRQAISWGQGRFLNPLDLVTPLGPFILDTEDVPGADALDASYYINGFDMIEVVLLPYKRMDDPNLNHLRSEDLNALTRLKVTLGSSDVILLAGHHFHSWVWGGEIATEYEGASFRFAYLGRAEKSWADFDGYGEDPPPLTSHQIVVGAGYAFFSGKLRTNAELFYNSGAYGDGRDPGIPLAAEKELLIETEIEKLPKEKLKEAAIEQYLQTGQTPDLGEASIADPVEGDPYFFRTAGRITTKNPLLVEFSLGGDLTDLLGLSLFFIGDPIGESLFFGPSLSYSLTDEAVLTAGAYFFVGPDDRTKAEFQGARPSAHILLRWHF